MEEIMWKYLRCFCSLFGHSNNLKEKQPLLHRNLSSEGGLQLTAEDITNRIIKIFNHDLAQEIAGLFSTSAVSDNIPLRQQVIDIDRMRHEVVYERARSHNKITSIEREFNTMYIALGQNRDSNIQFCISDRLSAALPACVIIHPRIEKTERAEQESVVNLIINDAAIIKDDAKQNTIALNLLCKIAIKTDSILLQLIDVTTQNSLVSITETIHNKRRETFSCDSRTVYI